MDRTRIAAAALAACVALGTTACGASDESSPSPSTAATASPTASPTEQQSNAATADWERVEVAEAGFAISLPRGWEVADLTSGDIEEFAAVLGRDPQLAPLAEQLPSMLASGVALFAVSIDDTTADTGFATNLNVIVEKGVTASLDLYAATNASYIEQTFSLDVERRSASLPAGDAVILEYEPTVAGVGHYHTTQFVLLSGRNAVIATFSRAADPAVAGREAEFADIMDTLELEG